MTAHMPIAELIGTLNKKFGAGTLVRASDAKGLVKPRISTGSFSLDIVTGGGFPEGAIELIEGEEASSKSWGLHSRAAHFQRAHPNGAYILVNAEGTNDPPFLEMLGVDLDRTWIVSPNSGEEAWDVVVEVAKQAEKVYVGIDSLDTLVPTAELEGAMDEHKMAPAARQNNKGFRKLITAMRSDIEKASHRVTMGVICQVRTNIGVMFGDPTCTVGGKGKNYAAMMRTRYRCAKRLATEGKTLAERVVYGLEIEVHVMKNKGVGEGEKVRYQLFKENYEGFRRGQIDNVTELVPFLLLYKIANSAGPWIALEDGTKFKGQDAFTSWLRVNDAEREKLIARVKEEVAKRHRIVDVVSAVEEKPAARRLARFAKKKG